MRRNRSLLVTVFGLAVFSIGILLAVTLLNSEVKAIFEGIITEQVYTVLRSPTWDEGRISADLYSISMQSTQLQNVSMDVHGTDIQQVSAESKVLPLTQIGDQLVSPDGAHTVSISGSLVSPTIRLDDQDIAPGLDPAWSPDSTEFAFVNKNNDLLVYNVAQRQLRTIYPPLKIACPPTIVQPNARLIAQVTNMLNESVAIVVAAETSPPISISPLNQEIRLNPGAPQSLAWDAYTPSRDRYQLMITAAFGEFSTTKACGMVVMEPIIGGMSVFSGHVISTALMVVGFLLILPRILSQKRLWVKILLALPFVVIVAFEVLQVLRLSGFV